MTNEYTPTENDVRARWYGDNAWMLSDDHIAEIAREFDRFIAQVKTDALEEFIETIRPAYNCELRHDGSEDPRMAEFVATIADVIFQAQCLIAEYRSEASR